ncbi:MULTISPECIES: multidrug efflux SMR transporter [unclassified Paenibacillus]|uniref:DMT family transporter n=1 Tax=unclassified Paenibacillus TaxID=185978 RepID=UPI001AE2DEA8|nr:MULTISPECIES: multidrug efflux SMR transporter [unclassified Paenibacillus]MBP1154830.1 small multidrug resistance pump [Paenibacillus sp. PvP091]MBP1169786.1 small multidrug resistance pump [Paenibacillus sp. PvR098]MBP2440814.1 small multidrug resistance pump [Paenibacillus sp. PvP052]
MKAYLFLALAIVFELFGTSMLKASEGFTKVLPSVGVIIGFSVAFYSLSLSLQQIPLGIAYAIWSGVGTAATALIGFLVWKEKLNMTTVLGVMLIIAGVIVLNLKTVKS